MLLWTGVGEQLIPLTINGCGVVCPLQRYKMIIDVIRPKKEDLWCLSVESRCQRDREFPMLRSKRYGPILNLRNNDARIAFAIAGYDILSFKYGKKLLDFDSK